MAEVLKYWPVALFALNLVAAWACWSLRQLARSEVRQIVDAAVAALAKTGEEIADEVDDHGDRILKVEGRIDTLDKVVAGLPTKADLARVEGEVRAVGVDAAATKAGVDRLEGYFLQRGVERVS